MKVKIVYAKEREIEIDDKFKKLEKEYDDDLVEELDTIMYDTLKDNDTLIRVLSTETNTLIMENECFFLGY